MKHLLACVALALIVGHAMPARAIEPLACTQWHDEQRADKAASLAADCIKSQDAQIQANTKAVSLIWVVARNPLAILTLLDSTAIRAHDSDTARFQDAYFQIAAALDPGATDRPHALDGLRQILVNPATLSAIYEASKGTFIAKLEAAALKGVLEGMLKESLPILQKPLTLNAASAAKWYVNSCYEPDPSNREEDECKKLAQFEATFKADYGVAPTRTSSFVLSLFYRRYLEGGSELVAVCQRIALDLAGQYGLVQADK